MNAILGVSKLFVARIRDKASPYFFLFCHKKVVRFCENQPIGTRITYGGGRTVLFILLTASTTATTTAAIAVCGQPCAPAETRLFPGRNPPPG